MSTVEDLERARADIVAGLERTLRAGEHDPVEAARQAAQHLLPEGWTAVARWSPDDARVIEIGVCPPPAQTIELTVTVR